METKTASNCFLRDENMFSDILPWSSASFRYLMSFLSAPWNECLTETYSFACSTYFIGAVWYRKRKSTRVTNCKVSERNCRVMAKSDTDQYFSMITASWNARNSRWEQAIMLLNKWQQRSSMHSSYRVPDKLTNKLYRVSEIDFKNINQKEWALLELVPCVMDQSH